MTQFVTTTVTQTVTAGTHTNSSGTVVTDPFLRVTETGSIVTQANGVETLFYDPDDPEAPPPIAPVEITLDGSIHANLSGIVSLYGSASIDVGETGSIRAQADAILLNLESNVVYNWGSIGSALTPANGYAASGILLDGSIDNDLFNAGTITGYYGIRATAQGQLNRIVNTGSIGATDTAILLSEFGGLTGRDNASLAIDPSLYGVTNSGTIEAGDIGIQINVDGRVVNTGYIHAGNIGVALKGPATFLTNTGTIIAAKAFEGSSSGIDTVTNEGTLQGDAELRGGADFYDGRLGRITGLLDLGIGNDTAYGGDERETVHAGVGNDRVFGYGGNDILDGGSGEDFIDGGAGADFMAGDLGNDVYIVDDIGDVVSEIADGGTDTVEASISYALTDDVENLVLTGTDHIDGIGNALANTILGNDGDNVLDGGAGADVLSGGLGNDTYLVDDAAEIVTEEADAGTDTVRASVSYALSASVENLVLTGAADLDGAGNALANALTGNAGKNVLDGGAGADRLDGGEGDDTYIVDHEGDLVVESAGAGIDSVQSSVSWILGTHVEHLMLTGAGNVSGTGNGLANILLGNAGDNVLDGGAGADELSGGLGSDTYVVDHEGDLVTEAADAGSDLVMASISYELGVHLEALTLTGSEDLFGIGNDIGNVLSGNQGDNRLEGGAGDDRLDGGAGTDIAVFSGARADYDITRNADGSFTVADLRDGEPDGTDALRSMELMQFSDGTISLPTKAPSAPALQGAAAVIDENAAPHRAVATVRSPDAANGDVTYALAANPGGKFAIDPATGAITLIGSVNYEATTAEDPDLKTIDGGTPQERKYYELAVQATEAVSGWASASTTVRVYVNNINEAPTGFAFANGNTTATISATAADGTLVGALQASDPENAGELVYAFDTSGNGGTSGSGNAGGRFKIENGQLKVAALSPVTKQETYTVTLKVTDQNGAGTSTYRDFLITVNPSGTGNEAPADIRLEEGGTTATISEMAEANAPVGTVTATDNDGGPEQLRYSIADNAHFGINENSGVIFVKAGAALDFETATSHAVTVTVTDHNGEGASASQTITINLGDENEAPDDITFTGQQVVRAGATQAGATVVLATAIDPDTGDAFRNNKYAFVVGNQRVLTDGKFTIDEDTGEITANAEITEADVGSKTLQVVAYDGALERIENHTVTIAAAQQPVLNTAPTGIEILESKAVDEYATGAVVGTLSATDPDADETFTFTLTDDAGGRFAINARNEIVVKNGFLLDYEQARSHQVKVHVSDKADHSIEASLTIALGDVNPEITAGSADNDVFFGGALNDRLSGQLGNDRLFGGAGKDVVRGEAGHDTLGGGAGRDKLYGGKATKTDKSKDAFLFDTRLKSKATANKHKDNVYDFQAKYDALFFDGAAFRNKAIARLDKKAKLDKPIKIKKGWFTFDRPEDKDDYFIVRKVNKKTSKIYFDADGAGRKAMLEVGTIKHDKVAISHKDFFIV